MTDTVTDVVVVPVDNDTDVGRARRAARVLAASVGLDRVATERVVLATSELATNLVRYARDGVLILGPHAGERGTGVRVESRDAGPGIGDLQQALTDGFSTGGGMGSGLPSVRRLMDSFAITTGADGTRIVAATWPAARS